jgi:hypothetical protein
MNIADLEIPLCDSWSPEDNSLASPYIGSGSRFNTFSISHSGFYAVAGIEADFIEGYDIAFGRDPEADGYDAGPAQQWLNNHLSAIEDFFTGRYGATFDEGYSEWGLQCLYFVVEVDGATSPDDAFERLYANDKTAQLYNELDPGTFGCPYVFRLLREHIERQITLV